VHSSGASAVERLIQQRMGAPIVVDERASRTQWAMARSVPNFSSTLPRRSSLVQAHWDRRTAAALGGEIGKRFFSERDAFFGFRRPASQYRVMGT